jgi:hypothetical protein
LKREPTLYLLLLLTFAHVGCEPEASEPRDGADDDDSMIEPDASTTVGPKDAAIDARASNDASARPLDAKVDGGAGNPNVRVGEFSLQLIEKDRYTKFLGIVSDVAAPSMYVWSKQDEASGCVLSTPRSPFCEESCGTSTCVADDVCQKSPTGQYVGDVTVRGVKTSTGTMEFTLKPTNSSNTYQPVGFSLPYPAFEEGDPIEVSAAGGDVGPIMLKGKGISPLVMPGSDEGYPLERGKGLALTWTAPKSGDGSRIQVKLDISHHGGVKGMIECDVPDNGSLNIPAKLTDALLNLGIAGFPTVMVTRSSVSSATTSLGRVDLKVYMYIESEIKIPGLVSCASADAPCPDGKSCNTKSKVCE